MLRRAVPAAAALSALIFFAAPPRLTAADVTVTIDPYGSRRPINPLIYGVNFGDPARMAWCPIRSTAGAATR